VTAQLPVCFFLSLLEGGKNLHLEAEKWAEYFGFFWCTEEKLLLAGNIKRETNCLLLISEGLSFSLTPGCLF